MPKTQFSDFLSILYRKQQRETMKPNFVIAEKNCMSRFDWRFRKGYRQEFAQGVY